MEISTSLADWAAASSSSDGGKTADSRPGNRGTDEDAADAGTEDPAASFTPFTPGRQPRSKKGKSQLTASSPPSPRRERQARRQKEDGIRRTALTAQISSVRDLLSENDLSVPTLLSSLSRIVREFGAPDDPERRRSEARTFFQTGSALDYTLAWVGSDDAICHVGTGLHNVPLARLQDIFLTVGNIGLKGGSWRMMEVIRILGPFPNVRNTLLGQVADVRKGPSMGDQSHGGRTGIQVRYDSIVDGVGKELNAGKQEDTRFVDLDVLFVDEEIIVCLVPSSDTVDGDDALGLGAGAAAGKDGKNVLLFLKEDELEEKLELMRVAG